MADKGSAMRVWSDDDFFRWVRNADLRAYNRIQFMVHHLGRFPRLQALYLAAMPPSEREHITLQTTYARERGVGALRVDIQKISFPWWDDG